MPKVSWYVTCLAISAATLLLTRYQFQDRYITRRSAGGESLADELLMRIREYLRPLYEDADSMDILVRVYVNMEGMANFLVREGKLRNLGQLRAFSTGFCGRTAGFDWVDVGVGKEGNAARKVRGKSLIALFKTLNAHIRADTMQRVSHSSQPIPTSDTCFSPARLWTSHLVISLASLWTR